MSTHRYPLPDGRQLEIKDPAMEGRAHFFIDGEPLGENTIDELRTVQTIALRDGSALTIAVAITIPFFRSFDVRVEGVLLPGATNAAKVAWSITVSALLWAAIVDFGRVDIIHGVLGACALVLAFLMWKGWSQAEKWSKRFLAFHID